MLFAEVLIEKSNSHQVEIEALSNFWMLLNFKPGLLHTS